jgi:Fe-S oxidoreductase
MEITPAQMMRMAQFGLEERLISDPSIWRCLGCDSCTEHCPYGISVRRLVELLRQRTMQTRYLPQGPEAFQDDEALSKGLRAMGMLGQRVQSFHNVSGEDNASRLAWTANLPGGSDGLDNAPSCEMIYFVGCVSAMFPMSYGIPQNFARILSSTDVSFTTLGDTEWCCGYPLLMAGQLEQARKSVRHNIERMRKSGASRLVTTCPSCYHMWHTVYPDLVDEPLGFEVVTASEVVADLLQQGRLNLAAPRRPGIVTYHDPCDLGRKGGHYDEPREALKRVPGFEFVEMQNNREHALCCGGGGDLETFDPDLVSQVAARRIQQAAEVSASYLVSACPQCVRTLTKAARAAKLRIRVMDIVQFVGTALAD